MAGTGLALRDGLFTYRDDYAGVGVRVAAVRRCNGVQGGV